MRGKPTLFSLRSGRILDIRPDQSVIGESLGPSPPTELTTKALIRLDLCLADLSRRVNKNNSCTGSCFFRKRCRFRLVGWEKQTDQDPLFCPFSQWIHDNKINHANKLAWYYIRTTTSRTIVFMMNVAFMWNADLSDLSIVRTYGILVNTKPCDSSEWLSQSCINLRHHVSLKRFYDMTKFLT